MVNGKLFFKESRIELEIEVFSNIILYCGYITQTKVLIEQNCSVRDVFNELREVIDLFIYIINIATGSFISFIGEIYFHDFNIYVANATNW